MVRSFGRGVLAVCVGLAWAAPLGAEPAEPRIPLIGAVKPAAPEKPIVTGSLSQPSTRTLRGFADHVEAGAITLRTSTPTSCLPGDLKAVLAAVSARFGAVSVQSTHRSAADNRRKGGARRSLHIACRAIDFRVRAPSRGVLAFLRERPEVGGLKLYRNGLIHIDNGERRTW